MSLTKKDKENLLDLLDKAKNFEDLKLVLRVLITLEKFTDK